MLQQFVRIKLHGISACSQRTLSEACFPPPGRGNGPTCRLRVHGTTLAYCPSTLHALSILILHVLRKSSKNCSLDFQQHPIARSTSSIHKEISKDT